MKILAIHSIFGQDDNTKSAVDMWRIWRPLRELKKHVDWQIDERPTLIPGIEKYKNSSEFTEEEMDKAFRDVCRYDIVFSSYHADPTGYTLLKVAEAKSGTQFVMDIDDDMFAVNPDNPFWMKMTDENCYQMQCMIRDNTWISTTTEALADVFRQRRLGKDKSSVFVNPNFITDDYKHEPVDNGGDIVIGYFGGSSHYTDIHETGVIEAIERLMHENKNIRFKSVGMIVDKYLPRKRFEFVEGKRFNGWLYELYPNLNLDISIAPLDNNIFNRGKSNIKWQESTRAGACFVASDIGPYSELSEEVAVKVSENTSSAWYEALKTVIDDAERRKRLVLNAQKELEKWRLEDNWKIYKEMFEKIKEYKDANNPTSSKSTILRTRKS